MKFLLNTDIQYSISQHLLDQATCDQDGYVELAETRALETVTEFLGANYDMEKELRAFVEYKPNIEYSDLQRVYVNPKSSLSASTKAFGEERGITLLNSGVTIETVFVKETNSCPLSATTYYQSKDSFLSIPYPKQTTFDKTFNNSLLTFELDNEDYDETCGEILYSASTGTSLYYKTDTIKNYYTVEYVPNGEDPEYIQSSCTYNQIYDVVPLDFEYQYEFSGKTPGDFVGDKNYFEQYQDSSDFTADDRNPTLIRIVTDLLLGDLLTRTGMENDVRMDRYKKALKDLLMIKRGELTIDLERLDKQEQGQSGMRIRWTKNYDSQFRNDY
jgi:hypothetical protein